MEMLYICDIQYSQHRPHVATEHVQCSMCNVQLKKWISNFT